MPRKKAVEEEKPLEQPLELRRDFGGIIKENYLEYGNYVNNYRHLCRVEDGLKISYRRLIYAAMQFKRGEDIPTTTLISSVAKWHPHGLTGIEDLNAVLTLSGVFHGEGSFGSIGIDGVDNPHAATRYTKNRLSDVYWEILGDTIKEVPYQESPVGALEPAYIPTPLPLCFSLERLVSGLGVGISTVYPNFSPWSMYQAYLHNDPNLLEPKIDLLLDKNNSELKRLWETGKGRVIYSYKISRQTSPDGRTEGILFEGSTGIFTPKIKKFKKLEEEGKVYIEDMTDFNGPKLFVGRVPGARGITVENIEEIARKICYDATTYSLNISDGRSSFRIPLKDWLDYTYKNYIALITKVNSKKTEKCKFDIAVQEAIPLVANYIINTNPKASNEEIQGALNLPEEVLKVILDRPLNQIRKIKDNTDRIKALKQKLKDLKAFNPILYTEEIIKKL